MSKVILSDDRQFRYNQAVKCMDLIMNSECIGSEHTGRHGMNSVIRHLSAAGVSMGVFLQEYFTQKESKKVVITPQEEFKCCNRTFKNIYALNGHKRTCKS